MSKWIIAVLKAVVFLIAVFVFSVPAIALDQGVVDSRPPLSLWSIIAGGRIIGFALILTSVVVVALVVENFITIRSEKIVPGQLADQLELHIGRGNYDKAESMCKEDGSFLAEVVDAGLGRRGAMFGFFEMQNAMQEVSERSISRFYRKLEYLSFIGAIAPLLGLLGTVTGMIRAFNKIALTEGAARPSDLAGGISEALVTTCMGLVVAIPTMFFVTFFRNRIDSYVAEAETVVDKLLGRFRQGTG